MALHLKPMDGPNKDQLFLLRPGFVMGRSEGDLIVPSDGKLSSRHAFVGVDERGKLILIDNGSKNGIRVAGEYVEQVDLTEGRVINLGSYTYEVVDQEPQKLGATVPKARYWHEILVEFIQRNLPKITNRKRQVKALHPAVILDFVRGTQLDTRWILGFGPRRVGAKSADLPIHEPGAPDVCFEILPTAEGISFKTDHPNEVTLNGKAIRTDVLRIADVIRIRDTEIEVDFIE